MSTKTKAELTAAVAETAQVSKSDAAKIIDSLMTVVTQDLASGNEVTLPGLGKLVPQERAARQVRNPSTGEMMQKDADRAVKFKPAKSLKDAVNA